ncbi:MAG: hypothetical protein LBI63_00480 [Candidatus Ancillula sp.]|jgi:hypothetical protein|nr:hypothetical protein [Candidatus Ancillula sp.]
MTKNNQQPQAEPTQEVLHDTKELPRIYVQKQVMVFKKFMSKLEKAFHISLISIYFVMLSAISVMRFVFGYSFDPDPREYPYNHEDLCDRDPDLMGAECLYHHRPNDFTFDVATILIFFAFFIYAQFILRKTGRKSLRIISIIIRISAICCIFTTSIGAYCLIMTILFFLAIVISILNPRS